jgi:hypothetical protein
MGGGGRPRDRRLARPRGCGVVGCLQPRWPHPGQSVCRDMIRGGSNGLRAHFTRATCPCSPPYRPAGCCRGNTSRSRQSGGRAPGLLPFGLYVDLLPPASWAQQPIAIVPHRGPCMEPREFGEIELDLIVAASAPHDQYSRSPSSPPRSRRRCRRNAAPPRPRRHIPGSTPSEDDAGWALKMCAADERRCAAPASWTFPPLQGISKDLGL